VHPNPTLREHVRASAENRPGVYRMFGPDGQLLYVGKSVRVRSRLLSYFRAARGEKAWELARESARIDWEYIPNEFAALVREMKQIQSAQPRFNVQHKRRKIYSFVKITSEAAPRVLPVTRIAVDGAQYFGPFPRVGAVARIVRELAHTLGLRDCPGPTPVFYGDQLEIFGSGRMPRCLRAELRSCLAPCCGRPTLAEYGAAVATARAFLEGRGAGPLREIEARMADASRRMDFEYAALLRDRLERLGRFRDELTGFRGTVEDLSFVYRVPGHHGDDRVYLIRKGRIRRDLPLPKGRAARARVAAAVEEVYDTPDHGPSALSSEEAAEILLVARWFKLNPEERHRTVRPADWLRDHGPERRRAARAS
jgi:excinuclease ABC subunit C